tara:strand:- start:214 stop:450 length:237 start_codon:yes stop_codon:yes gene_type:complete
MKINPKTQQEADFLYKILSHKMSNEVIYQDGEVTEQQARTTYLYWLKKAKKIERLGFKPTIDSDVFFPVGHVPTGWYY